MRKFMTPQSFISKRPHLVWYTNHYDQLSEEAIVEAVLNDGTMNDVKTLLRIMDVKRVAKIFRAQSRRRRSNYDPMIRNYFGIFFKKYAP